jgi:predicted dienelactone hydrolase
MPSVVPSHWLRLWLCAVVTCTVVVGTAARAFADANRSSARVHVFEFVDHSRTITLPDGRRVPRRLETVVRSPAVAGSHPLIVFAHGFALTPARYKDLLEAWAAAGYVVAAPVFPLTNANAPGGPNEADLVDQPRDMTLVITRLLALNARPGGVLGGEIDPSRIAVAGQSDGGITALAVAYDSRFRDRRVRAAVILSGARLSGMGPFPRGAPPLLAVQGTADPFNAPATTATYFGLAARPKFLLWLLGASHLPPYTDQQPQLGIVERTSIAFLGHYLEGDPLGAIERAARASGLTRLVAEP